MGSKKFDRYILINAMGAADQEPSAWSGVTNTILSYGHQLEE
jgi:hypothetical protein